MYAWIARQGDSGEKEDEPENEGIARYGIHGYSE
jgi:hypothetical protein